MTKLIRRPTSGRQDFLYVPLIVPSLILVAQPATAQDDEVLEEIVTTGSLIRREQSSNIVVTLDDQELIDRGVSNPVEILDTIPSIQASEVTSNTLNLFNPSFANFANLRSLGGQSTLTLLDGKRVVRDPFAGIATNLNVLPQAAVSSVDILPDGASSIYGSDAIAGVINFKMYEEYEGSGLNATSTFPTEGEGGGLNKFSTILGVGDLDADGHNFYVAASARNRDDLRAGDRDYLDGPWGGVLHGIIEPGADPNFGTRREAFPGNVRQRNNPLASGQIATNTGASPYPDCPVMSDQLSTEDIHAVGDGSCVYTLTGLNFVTISEEEQHTLASQVSKRFADEHTFSLQFFHAWSDITRERPWPRIQGRQIPVTSPYYPGNGIVPAISGQDMTSAVQTYGISMVALERPEETVTDRTWRLMASVDGVIGAFDYEVWALQSEAEFEQAIVSYDNRWVDGIDGTDGATWINPWADFAGQSPAAQAYIAGNYMGKVKDRIADAQLRNVGFTLGRDIEQIDVGAGAAALAFAFEYTEEELFTGLSLERLAATNQTPEIRLGPDRNVSGARDLYSATLEVQVPITDELEVSASVRYDDYSDVGDTTNPKLLINYDVMPNVNLHASFGKGFRAPTLVDLFKARSLVGTIPAAAFIFDRELCPDGVTPSDPRDDTFNVCDLRVNRITGGNLDLKPEESETFAIGTAISFDHDQTGFGNIAVALDYWDYRIDNVVNTGIPPEAIFGDWDRFASDFIFRCSTFTEEEIDRLHNCPDDPALRFNDYIGAVLQTNANIGVVETSGVDFRFLWDLPSDIGDWAFTYNATYVTDYDQEVYEGSGVQSRLNRFLTRHFGPALQLKHYATLRWSNDDWTGFLQHQFQNGYDDCGSVCRRPDREVDSHGIFNIGGWYQVNDAIRVNLRVDNLFQNDPPFTNNSGAGSITTENTDVRYFDHIGRRVGLTLTADFE